MKRCDVSICYDRSWFVVTDRNVASFQANRSKVSFNLMHSSTFRSREMFKTKMKTCDTKVEIHELGKEEQRRDNTLHKHFENENLVCRPQIKKTMHRRGQFHRK